VKTEIFLDSSFFFPFIGVEVENCEKSDVLNLITNENFQIFRSELTTFELSAKGVKLVNEGEIEITDLIDGLNSLQFMNSVKVIPIFYSEIQILSSKFRKDHTDFIDCIILASAINYSQKLISFDRTLKRKFLKKWQNEIQTKKNFEMILWDDFKRSL